jgi:hemerythrin-like metal-binding protein
MTLVPLVGSIRSGIEPLDAQTSRVLEAVDEISERLHRGSVERWGELARRVEALLATKFENEEREQRRLEVPDVASHRQAHCALLATMRELRGRQELAERHRDGASRHAGGMELMRFLRSYIVDHLFVRDLDLIRAAKSEAMERTLGMQG